MDKSIARTTNNRPATYVKRPIEWDSVRVCLQAGVSIEQTARAHGFSAQTFRNRCREEHGVPLQELAEQWRGAGISEVMQSLYTIAKGGDVKAIREWLARNVGPAPGSSRNTNINIGLLSGVSGQVPGIVIVDRLTEDIRNRTVVIDAEHDVPRLATPEEQERITEAMAPQVLLPENGMELLFDAEGNAIPYSESEYRERCRAHEWTAEDEQALQERLAHERQGD